MPFHSLYKSTFTLLYFSSSSSSSSSNSSSSSKEIKECMGECVRLFDVTGLCDVLYISRKAYTVCFII